MHLSKPNPPATFRHGVEWQAISQAPTARAALRVALRQPWGMLAALAFAAAAPLITAFRIQANPAPFGFAVALATLGAGVFLYAVLPRFVRPFAALLALKDPDLVPVLCTWITDLAAHVPPRHHWENRALVAEMEWTVYPTTLLARVSIMADGMVVDEHLRVQLPLHTLPTRLQRRLRWAAPVSVCSSLPLDASPWGSAHDHLRFAALMGRLAKPQTA